MPPGDDEFTQAASGPGREGTNPRLATLLDRLGPDWDEKRVVHAPTDEETVQDTLEWMRGPSGPDAGRRRGLSPTGGWIRFLLPFAGVVLIVYAVVLMGMLAMDPAVGGLMVAAGVLLIILAALGRGRRIEERDRRREAEEILLYYDLEPSADREAFLQQVDLVRDAKRELEEPQEPRGSRV